MKQTLNFKPATYFPTTLADVVGGYKGKGNYKLSGKSGIWYIRAATSGWGYIASPVE